MARPAPTTVRGIPTALFALVLCWLAVLSTDSVVAQGVAPVGEEFQVNGYTTGEQILPDAILHDDGTFEVVWTTSDTFYGPDNSGYSVAGQR